MLKIYRLDDILVGSSGKGRLKGELLILFSQLVIKKDTGVESEKGECARKIFY
ncbi:MAG: hypothetical protein WKF71_20785 [Pyrinomonadaceae bacterium]